MHSLLGWRRGQVPNIADGDNQTSVAIATEIFTALKIPPTQTGPDKPGRPFELAIAEFVSQNFPRMASHYSWHIEHKGRISDFQQYRHLARLEEMIKADKSRMLSAEIGRDYVIRPDVTVGLAIGADVVLHAAISCKWSMRSDRVQNVRHEAVVLTRHRRGRQPHILSVTAEPLPSRLASLARGTGEVDAVYHVALDELVVGTAARGTNMQRDVLDELVGQGRLRSFDVLLDTLLH